MGLMVGGTQCLPMRDASFPLTLILSLREREQLPTLSDIPMFRMPAPRCDMSKCSECAPKWQTILHLPMGEGRGEGKEHARRRTASNSG